MRSRVLSRDSISKSRFVEIMIGFLRSRTTSWQRHGCIIIQRGLARQRFGRMNVTKPGCMQAAQRDVKSFAVRNSETDMTLSVPAVILLRAFEIAADSISRKNQGSTGRLVKTEKPAADSSLESSSVSLLLATAGRCINVPTTENSLLLEPILPPRD